MSEETGVGPTNSLIRGCEQIQSQMERVTGGRASQWRRKKTRHLIPRFPWHECPVLVCFQATSVRKRMASSRTQVDVDVGWYLDEVSAGATMEGAGPKVGVRAELGLWGVAEE